MNSISQQSLQISDLKAEAINVVVRCRGRTDREIALKSDIVVEVPDKSGSDEVSINTTDDNSIVGKIASKTFTVDQVFGPGADQELIFNNVASPLFDNFLKGYNCTIFAYGQTGTGKTHTMCGDDRILNGKHSPNSGIIPRVLFKLFDTLNNLNNDFVIKCSLVEIYNESLKDLLNPKSKKELKIYEEQIKTIPGKPDKSAVFIKDLEEFPVRNAVEGLELLRKGLIDRKTASTNMNKSSSRSHTIFSISLYKKEMDELYRFSKMNLVDLAGSENISRSGATDMQAKEAGSINKSLLSLGKVINALVDNNLPPYRDSKLTRLLKDSLGGETKTVLIANISPSSLDSDETSKTLEYASKAKNVMNTPQVGNLMLKHVVVKDLVDEVAKLRKDLTACWAKDGVMLDKENFEQMKRDTQHYKIQVEEMGRKLEFQQNQNKILTHDLNSKMNEVVHCKDKLKDLQQVNNILSGKLQKQQNSERMLYDSTKKYKELISLFDGGVQEFESFQKRMNAFLKTEMRDNLESQSKKLVDIVEQNLNTKVNIKENTKQIKMVVEQMVQQFQDCAFEICDNTTNSLTAKLPASFEALKQEISRASASTENDFNSLNSSLNELQDSNLKFDKYLSQNLFTNHDELLQRHIDAINTQNEANKKEFISSFLKLFESHNNKTAMQFPAQLQDLRKQIIDSEKDLLAGNKYDWIKATTTQTKASESLVRKLVTRVEDNNNNLKLKIDDLNNVTSDSKLILEDERKKIAETVGKLESNRDIDHQLQQLQTKFKSTTELKEESMDRIISVAEQLTTSSMLVRDKTQEDFKFMHRDKISQLMQTIDHNEKLIDSQLAALPKSRNASPVRQASITPKRELSRPPVLSVSRQRSVSRPTSRVSSRSASPVKSADDNKENVLKRKISDDVDSAEQQQREQQQHTVKRVRSLPPSVRPQSTIPRKPFR